MLTFAQTCIHLTCDMYDAHLNCFLCTRRKSSILKVKLDHVNLIHGKDSPLKIPGASSA